MSALIVSEKDRARFESRFAKSDSCWMWTAGGTGGYGTIRINDRDERAHRVAYVLSHGQIPDGMLIDHICFNRRCVNPDHLRVVTPKQNIEHRTGANRTSASGLRGVYKRADRVSKPYQAYVRNNGRLLFGGYFATAEEAALKARSMRSELFTHADELPSERPNS